MLFQLIQQQLLCSLPQLGTLLLTSPVHTNRVLTNRLEEAQYSRPCRVWHAEVSPTTSYGCALLKSWCRSIENEHRSDPVKQQPADSPEESKQMSIMQHLALLVAHGFDELHKPDGGICKAADHTVNLAQQEACRAIQATRAVPTARRLFVKASMFTRLPTGSRSGQRPCTPIAVLSGRHYLTILSSFAVKLDHRRNALRRSVLQRYNCRGKL